VADIEPANIVPLEPRRRSEAATLRVWADAAGVAALGRLPTTKGIACNVALIPELIEALQRAEAAARQAGLL
jgi:hypothetical protein